MTEEQILQALEKMKKTIDDGYSIEVAKNRAYCTDANSIRYKAVTRHPKYIELLNYYAEQRKLNRRYQMVDGKIKQISVKKKPTEAVGTETAPAG